MSGDVTAMDINCALASRYRRDGDGYWTEISVTEPNDTVLRLDGVALEVNWRGDTWISGFEVKVSRGDFLRDAKYLRYKDYADDLTLVCPARMIDRSEVPEPVCHHTQGGIMSVSRESVHPDYIPEDFGELLRMAVDYVYEQGEHYSEDALLEAFKPAIDKHDRQVAERAFELGCVAVDAEEHGVGCRFTVGQLEELSRDYGRDAYSVNNPYGRGES